MQTLRRLTLLLVVGLMTAWALPAAADALDQAKAQGYLGERPDGYLGQVKTAPPDVTNLMREINGKRRQNYQRIAEKRGIPRQQVEAIAGKKLIEKTPPGQYVMDASGNWIRK